MPYIEPRKDKEGNITCYRLVVSEGMDYQGRQIRRYKTWRPSRENMSQKQMEKEAIAAAYEFEKKVQQGFVVNNNQKFCDYAQYVLDLKKRTGLAPSTYERYQKMLLRINAKIGHIRLSELRPQHLNNLYRDLAENGVREDTDRAVARKGLARKIEKLKLPKHVIAEECNISHTSLNAVLKGNQVTLKTARGIADAMGYDMSDLFILQHNAAPLSDKTILEHHRLISSILSMAERELLIPYNPAAKATPPRVRKHKAEYFQPEETEDIINALEDAPIKWKAMTYLLIDTGCRRSELMGLQWKHINLDKGTIMIEQALLYTKEDGIYVGPTKNGQPRAVCIAPESVAVLKRWKTKQLELKIKCGPARTDNGFVFTKDDGNWMHPDSITDWLNKFSKEKDLPHIHPHAFRHTAASLMIANGIDLVTTAAELGHANATTTANIYAHQVARARAEAAGVRAGVFETLHRKNRKAQ